jgi:hypothetical protein
VSATISSAISEFRQRERRFVHIVRLAWPMTRRGRTIMMRGIALLFVLMLAIMLLAKQPSVWAHAKPLFAFLILPLVLAFEQELVVDQSGVRLEYAIFPFRRHFVWRKVLWVDRPTVHSYRAMSRRASKRYNLVVKFSQRARDFTSTLPVRFSGFPILLLQTNQWIERGDEARFRELKRQRPWWRLTASFPPFPAYSDAPELFKLPDVLAEFGHAPIEVDARVALPGAIDTKKPAVAVSMGAGLIAAVAAIVLATQSVWLYVDPSQGWIVAAVGGSVAAAIIALVCRATNCDGASTAGAMVSGAMGFAFLAAIAAPDVSAASESSRHQALFQPEGAVWVTKDSSSPVLRLDEPPLHVKARPTQVTVACGIPAICAFKRTDFEPLR